MILGALAFAAFAVFRERTGFDVDRTHANFRGVEALAPEAQERTLNADPHARLVEMPVRDFRI
jgi:hypothetical protein